MEAPDRTQKLRDENRDAQREQMGAYPRVTQQPHDLQRRAVVQQRGLVECIGVSFSSEVRWLPC